MAASSPEGQVIREPEELTWNRGGDANTTEKVICSPWIHPSGIQRHKPNLLHHQHIINPHTSLYRKNLMNARLQKQYCNSISDKNILDPQSISFSYAMSPAYHKYNLSGESRLIFTRARVSVCDTAKVGKKLKTYCCDAAEIWESFIQTQAAKKQKSKQVPVIYISAAHHVPSVIVIFITANTMARSLLSARC